MKILSTFARLAENVPVAGEYSVQRISLYEYLNLVSENKIVPYEKNRGGLTHDKVKKSLQENGIRLLGFGVPSLCYDSSAHQFVIADGNTRTQAVMEFVTDEGVVPVGDISVKLHNMADFLEVYTIGNTNSGHTVLQKISNTDTPAGKYTHNFLSEYKLTEFAGRRFWPEIAGLLATIEEVENPAQMSVGDLHQAYVKASDLTTLNMTLNARIRKPVGRAGLGALLQHVQTFMRKSDVNTKAFGKGFLPIMYYLSVTHGIFDGTIKDMHLSFRKNLSGESGYKWYECLRAVARKSKSGITSFKGVKSGTEPTWDDVIAAAHTFITHKK